VISRPVPGAVALSLLPAFEYGGSVGIEVTLSFTPWPGIRGHSSLEPMPHGSFADAQLTGHLFHRTSLLAQAHGLLIACISLGAADRNGPRNMRSWVWTPFFHGHGGLFLSVCFSLCLLVRRFHLGKHARQQALDSF
jgi:hypothetical protein